MRQPNYIPYSNKQRSYIVEGLTRGDRYNQNVYQSASLEQKNDEYEQYTLNQYRSQGNNKKYQ